MPLTPSEKADALARLRAPIQEERVKQEQEASAQTADWWNLEESDVQHGPQIDDVKSNLELVRQSIDDKESGTSREPGSYSPRYFKPLTRTVRGIDLSTGKRELTRGDENDERIEDDTQAGVELLRQSTMHVQDGPDDVGMQGMARVARATLREGGNYEDVKRYLSQYGASDDRVHAAVNIAEESMLQDDLVQGYSTGITAEEIASVRADKTEYQEQDLLLEDSWVEASKILWEAENNSTWDGTRQDLWQYGLETMSQFNNNIAGNPLWHPNSMAYYTVQAMSRSAYQDNQYAKALYTLLDMYDRTEIGINSIGRGASAMAPWNDPAGWLAGGALLNTARRVGLRRMKRMLNESTALGGIEGGLFLGADELSRQLVATEAGAQEEVSGKSVAGMALGGTIAGAGLSKILDFAASPQMVDNYKKWGRKLLDGLKENSGYIPIAMGAAPAAASDNESE